MKADYDAKSFWAGVTVGTQLHGVGAYGVMAGWNPDSDLILRPITQGVGRISFGADQPFTICGFTDTVECVFPAAELPDILQEIGRIGFGADGSFTIRSLVERVVIDEVITAFTVDTTLNPLDYDDTIVLISGGAFTMDTMTRTFTSSEETVDIGTMQEVSVTVDEFAEVTKQEVTA